MPLSPGLVSRAPDCITSGKVARKIIQLLGHRVKLEALNYKGVRLACRRTSSLLVLGGRAS